MPVTFGAVQLVPAAALPHAQAKPAAPAPPPPAPQPLDLAPVMRHLHERATRVRAH